MPQPPPLLEHEKLRVYHTALQVSGLVATLSDHWPNGKGFLLDQLLRASTSIALNIAEGAGEHSSGEKARFYRMARRSATESAGCLDVAVQHGAITDEERQAGRTLLLEIVAVMTRLVLNLAPECRERVRPRTA